MYIKVNNSVLGSGSESGSGYDLFINDTNNYNYGCFEGCYNKKNDVLLHIFILFVIIFMLSLLP